MKTNVYYFKILSTNNSLIVLRQSFDAAVEFLHQHGFRPGSYELTNIRVCFELEETFHG